VVGVGEGGGACRRAVREDALLRGRQVYLSWAWKSRADLLRLRHRFTGGPVRGAGRFLGFKGSSLRPLKPILGDLKKEGKVQQVYYSGSQSHFCGWHDVVKEGGDTPSLAHCEYRRLLVLDACLVSHSAIQGNALLG